MEELLFLFSLSGYKGEVHTDFARCDLGAYSSASAPLVLALELLDFWSKSMLQY